METDTTPKGRILSGHAATDSLIRHGFEPPFDLIDDIIDNYTHTTTQTDGAIVYMQRVKGSRRVYHLVIVSNNNVITALRYLTPHELKNLARNYGWKPWL